MELDYALLADAAAISEGKTFILGGGVSILWRLEVAQEPAGREPRVPARVLAGDEHRELERVGEAELRQVFRGGHGHEDVAALQRPLERCVGVTGRARSSSSLGAGTSLTKP